MKTRFMFGYIPSINCDQAAAAQMQPGPCQLYSPVKCTHCRAATKAVNELMLTVDWKFPVPLTALAYISNYQDMVTKETY